MFDFDNLKELLTSYGFINSECQIASDRFNRLNGERTGLARKIDNIFSNHFDLKDGDYFEFDQNIYRMGLTVDGCLLSHLISVPELPKLLR